MSLPSSAFCGLPQSLYLELRAHMTLQVPDIPYSVTDLTSALTRPGSWEWHTREGIFVRNLLIDRGYHYFDDPKASWRVIWKKKENKDGLKNEEM